jgi:hypothetical protein
MIRLGLSIICKPAEAPLIINKPCFNLPVDFKSTLKNELFISGFAV